MTWRLALACLVVPFALDAQYVARRLTVTVGYTGSDQIGQLVALSLAQAIAQSKHVRAGSDSVFDYAVIITSLQVEARSALSVVYNARYAVGRKQAMVYLQSRLIVTTHADAQRAGVNLLAGLLPLIAEYERTKPRDP